MRRVLESVLLLAHEIFTRPAQEELGRRASQHCGPTTAVTYAHCRPDAQRARKGVFILGDARSFSMLTSTIPPLGSTLNFDADVKKRPRITNVKTPLLSTWSESGDLSPQCRRHAT